MLETPESRRPLLGDSATDWAISRKGTKRDREHDLHWLGGVWDGEGCFSIVLQRTRSRPQVAVIARFTNTSDTMIREVRRIMDAEGLAYHVDLRPPTKGKRSIWHLTFGGMKRTKRLLDVLWPYLRSKHEEAGIAMEFIGRRFRREVGAPYSTEEIDCFLRLRAIHGYTPRESSETLRSALSAPRGRKMIKSGLHGDMQSAAEMTAPAA